MRRLLTLGAVAVLLAGTAMAAETWERLPAQPKAPAVKKEAAATVRPFLGLAIEALPPALADQLTSIVPAGRGVLAIQVSKGSPADKAGLRVHDIVLKYGDREVLSPEQFVKLVQEDKVGREVKLQIVRGGKSEQIIVTLGERAMAPAPRVHQVFRQPAGEGRPHAAASQEKEERWSSFDSMTLTRIGENRFKAEIKYRDKEGKVDARAFEGTRDELRKAIESERGMPDAERGHLLRALDMSGQSAMFGQGVIWDFDDLAH